MYRVPANGQKYPTRPNMLKMCKFNNGNEKKVIPAQNH